MKHLHMLRRFRTLCFCIVALVMGAAITPAATFDSALNTVADPLETTGDHFQSEVGGTALGLGKDTLTEVANAKGTGYTVAAWRAKKMGGTGAALLAKSSSFKGASNLLGVGGKLIDHVGGVSTAAGEFSVGSPGQALLTLIDTFGKAAVSTVAGTAGATLGTAVAGPAGTVIGGGAAGYGAGKVWEKTIGSLIGLAKTKLGGSSDDAAERAISKTGETLAEIRARLKIEKIEKEKAIAAAKAAADKAAADKAAADKAAAQAAQAAKAAAAKAAAAKAAADKAITDKAAADQAAADQAAADKAAADQAAADAAAAAAQAAADAAAANAASVTIVEQGSVWDSVSTITVTEVTDSDGKKTIVYTTTDKDGNIIGKTVYDGDKPAQKEVPKPRPHPNIVKPPCVGHVG